MSHHLVAWTVAGTYHCILPPHVGVKRWIRSWLCHCPRVCRASPFSCVKGGGGTQWSEMLGLLQELGQVYSLLSTAGIWLPCSGSEPLPGGEPHGRGAGWPHFSPTLGESWMEGTGEPLKAVVSHTTLCILGLPPWPCGIDGRVDKAAPDPEGRAAWSAAPAELDPIGISCRVSSLEAGGCTGQITLLPSGPRLGMFGTLAFPPQDQPAPPSIPCGSALLWGQRGRRSFGPAMLRMLRQVAAHSCLNRCSQDSFFSP